MYYVVGQTDGNDPISYVSTKYVVLIQVIQLVYTYRPHTLQGLFNLGCL